ncbi:MAG: hypothetical protein IKC97_00110 [Clostridia bacterium]|nr:hypothetical protein [Clostridia bacterium]
MALDNIHGMLPDELNSRPSLLHLDTSPIMGDNFDLMLLRADAIVSAPSGKEGVARAVLCAARDVLLCPDAKFLAVVLPEYDRVALIAPLFATSSGEAMAVLPNIGAHSMIRVLRYAFADQVKLCGAWQVYGNEHIRAADENTYQYLQALLFHCRVLLSGADVLRITDRKQLSQQLIQIFSKIEAFFGIELDVHVREFPIPVSFEGAFCPLRALWMMLCLTLGIRYGCSKKARASVRFLPDEQLLLPMLEISAGNKTRLPLEWEECCRMAEREGMFFDVRRKRDSIRVRFCPMTPNISPQEFYSVKAMAPIIAGLEEMRLK